MNNILFNIIKNEDNPNINIIIENNQLILSNHNNQFYFKLSNIPFDKLYIFIKGVLEPPLLKIKNKYNLIEKQILIGIINITDNFPDFSKIAKEKLNIEGILEYIKLIKEELKITLLKYEKDLNDDYDTYINKLIHFTYINGLYTYDNPCSYSFCSISLNKNKDENKNKRNLKQISISKKNLQTKYKNRAFLNLDDIKIKNLINYVNGNHFDETKGYLSQEDLNLYLADMRNTIYELNETYIKHYDVNVKSKINDYINKIRITYIAKLKRIISTSTSKFASILPKEKYEKLIDNILEQFYTLENYILNVTHYLDNDINDYELKLEKSFNFLRLVNDLEYDKINGYYSILDELIETKYDINLKNMPDKEKEEKGDDEDGFSLNKIEKYFKIEFGEVLEQNNNIFEKVFGVVENGLSKIEKYFEKNFENNTYDEDDNDDEINLDLNSEFSKMLDDFKLKEIRLGIGKELLFKKNIKVTPTIIFFDPFPYFQIRIVPNLNISLSFNLGYELDFKENDYSAFFGLSGEAKVNLSLEIGCYIPPFPLGLETSMTLGINGVLGSGSVGMKISIFINKPKYDVERKFEFYSLKFTVYSLFKIKAELISFSHEYYLFKDDLNDEIGNKMKKKESYKFPKVSEISKNIYTN